MQKMNISAEIAVYESPAELSSADAQLLQQAKDAAETAYAPYSNFKVGAALLLENGTVVPGSNQENAAFPVTMCAERNAIFAASAQYPNMPIAKIAITIVSQKGNINKPVPPCGSCRQAIYEYEIRHKQDIELILQGDSGQVYIVDTMKDLLPLLFDSSYL
ncbi:MAG: cytidine deaminase [Aureispira sp.]|nr:cytidine deaminase [Aureispira sp.]